MTSAREHVEALERGWSPEFYAIELVATIFDTSEHVTREEFARASEMIFGRYSSIRALEWVPKVTHAEREAFVEKARRSMPEFDFVDVGPDGSLRPIGYRDVYYPIHYIEPLDSNRRALGYDPAGNEPRNQALQEAIDSGGLVVSAPTRLVQDVPDSVALEEYLRLVNEYRLENGDRTAAVSVSIGITEINSRSSSVGTVLGEADAACHIAKEQGRNRIHAFHSGDTVSDQYRGQMVWAAEVRQALDDDRLELHGQRIVPSDPVSASGEMLEILVRLRGRDGAMVSPADFIPAAERYNLMADVDRWVIEHALALKAARGDGKRIWCINLSGHSIGEEGVFEFIRRRLHHYEVAPESCCFEITETAVVRSLSKAERFISRLRGLGCLVALDDFGSGMSSFVYLKHLPVDFLKIDGSFVRNIQHDRMDRAMVHAIQQIASELGIRTIAEYVETATARRAVTDLGVDFVQGFHIDAPAPIEALD